jgi:hypothetical protein
VSEQLLTNKYLILFPRYSHSVNRTSRITKGSARQALGNTFCRIIMKFPVYFLVIYLDSGQKWYSGFGGPNGVGPLEAAR